MLTTKILLLFCTVLLLFSSPINGYKVGIFMIPISNSQVIFNVRVAELLADAGHDVTMIRPSYNPKCTKIKPKAPVREIRYVGLKNESTWDLVEEKQAAFAFKDVGLMDSASKELMDAMFGMLREGCKSQITNKEILERVKKENFDVVFSHMYDYCEIGLFHHLGIKSWIWLNSGPLVDNVAHDVGAASPPSYVPGIITDMTDRMSYFERFKNFMGRIALAVVSKYVITGKQTALFREHLGPDFPDVQELASKCPLVMVNSDEMFDFPRPILHKILYIGGIGMHDPKPLEGEFKSIVESSKTDVVIVSFGSVANSADMPLSWKQAFIGAFSEFPNVKFIFKFEKKDLPDSIPAPKNVLFTKWMPQADLLGHPNVKGFITHGGYNSMLEAVSAGKPLITIPLFGDQFRNSRLSQKHGFGYYLAKSQITKQNLINGVKAILTDKSYIESAEKMQQMVKKKPVKSVDLLVRWTEFLAEFKSLPNLAVAATDLNFIQYNCLDIIIPLLVALHLLLYLVYRLLKFLISFCSGSKSSKKLKTN